MKRTKLILGLAVAALVLAISGTANAQYPPATDPPPTPGDIPIVDVVRGETVDVRGDECSAGATVTVTYDDGTTLGTFTADADGMFVSTITIPSGSSLGEHLVTATCGEVEQFLRVNVLGQQIVRPGGAAPGGALPRTGSSNTAPLVGIGAGALVLGAAFLYGSRRNSATAE